MLVANDLPRCHSLFGSSCLQRFYLRPREKCTRISQKVVGPSEIKLNEKYKIFSLKTYLTHSYTFIVCIPSDTLWETFVLLVFFYFKYQYSFTDLSTSVAQEHLRSEALPDTTAICRESSTEPLVWKTHAMPYLLHRGNSLLKTYVNVINLVVFLWKYFFKPRNKHKKKF